MSLLKKKEGTLIDRHPYGVMILVALVMSITAAGLFIMMVTACTSTGELEVFEPEIEEGVPDDDAELEIEIVPPDVQVVPEVTPVAPTRYEVACGAIDAFPLYDIHNEYSSSIATVAMCKSTEYGLPLYVVYTLMGVESDFTPTAVSSLGITSGYGIAQPSYFALKEYNNRKLNLWRSSEWKVNQSDLTDIEVNLEVSLYYYKRLLNHYLPDGATYLDAYIAYNVGPTLYSSQRSNLYNGFYYDEHGKKVSYVNPIRRWKKFSSFYGEYFEWT